jgi:hypothetical protein
MIEAVMLVFTLRHVAIEVFVVMEIWFPRVFVAKVLLKRRSIEIALVFLLVSLA